MDRSTRTGVLAALGTEALYGGSFVFTKGVTATIDPFTLLAWRFATALAVLGVLVALRVVRLSLDRAVVKPLLVLALLQPLVYYTAETYGVMRTTASESALIISAIPVAMLATAAVLLGTRPSRRQAAGIAVTLVGVLVTVVAGGLSARFDAWGYALLFVAVLAFSLYAALAHRFAHTRDVDRTFVMVASGAVVFGTIAAAQHAAGGAGQAGHAAAGGALVRTVGRGAGTRADHRGVLPAERGDPEPGRHPLLDVHRHLDAGHPRARRRRARRAAGVGPVAGRGRDPGRRLPRQSSATGRAGGPPRPGRGLIGEGPVRRR